MVGFGGEEVKDFNSSCFRMLTFFLSFRILVSWREFWRKKWFQSGMIFFFFFHFWFYGGRLEFIFIFCFFFRFEWIANVNTYSMEKARIFAAAQIGARRGKTKILLSPMDWTLSFLFYDWKFNFFGLLHTCPKLNIDISMLFKINFKKTIKLLSN